MQVDVLPAVAPVAPVEAAPAKKRKAVTKKNPAAKKSKTSGGVKKSDKLKSKSDVKKIVARAVEDILKPARGQKAKKTKKVSEKKERPVRPWHAFPKKIGSKPDVFNGRAYQTSGGLLAADIIKARSGRIVSKAASEAAQKNWKLREEKKKLEEAQKASAASM